MTGEKGTGPPPSSEPPDDPTSAGLRTLPRPVAVVVGAGGVLGAAHVGVGHALEERGFVPDLIVGTSVGALNGRHRGRPSRQGRAVARPRVDPVASP